MTLNHNIVYLDPYLLLCVVEPILGKRVLTSILSPQLLNSSSISYPRYDSQEYFWKLPDVYKNTSFEYACC